MTLKIEIRMGNSQTTNQLPVSTTDFSILTHGDSITRGYFNFGLDHYPYATKLHQLLQQEFANISFEIQEQGVNGELTSNMSQRLTQTLAANTHFDFVLLLGGLNDLGYNMPSDSIVQNLVSMINQCADASSICLIATVPNNICDERIIMNRQNGDPDTKKSQINNALRDFVKNSTSEAVYLVDLEQYDLDFMKMTQDERKEVFNDSIHYSPVGYDRLANAMFQVLKPIIQQKLQKH